MKRKIGKKSRAPAFASSRHPHARSGSDGRVHLDLLRDPASGQAFVALRTAIFDEAWQNEIAGAAANTAYASLEGRPSVTRAVELARNMMAQTSRLSDGFLSRAPAGAVACKAGCAHCCYQAVGVTAPEALAVFDYLAKTLSTAELASVAARVAEARERTRGLSAAERFSPEHPCVFLESGRCSIYEVRPLSCRGMNSLDAAECEKRLNEPEARAEFLATGAGSRSFMEPIRAFHAVSAGLQLGLAELYRLDMRPLDLIAAIHLIFTRGESAARDWIAGRASFESARGGDSTNEFGIHDVSGRVEPTR